MPYDPRQDPKYKNDKLYLSLLKRESNFNPNAVSPTGARGYAQLLRSTAADPGFGIAPNPAAIHDPEQNVAFGKAYLDAMQKRYKGDTAAALVAYNGGPGAADRWVASGKNDKVISKESSDYYKGILKDAGSGYDFSKIKPMLPANKDDDDEEIEKTIGFAKLKKPGSKDAAKPSEDSDAEETDNEEEKSVAKVAKAKASKEKDDEDDDEEDDDKSGGGGKSSESSFDPEEFRPKLNAFTPGPMMKPMPVQLGIPKLQLAKVETLDDPRDR